MATKKKSSADDAPPEEPEYYTESHSNEKAKTVVEQKQEYIDNVRVGWVAGWSGR